MTETQLSFPDGFLWGAATSAYQIEGAVGERGASVWDAFSEAPGNIANGDTGRIACDHYHRWREDLDLMAAFGLRAYRFSVAWPRVMPTGSGSVDSRGLDFYDRLVDGLVERGITPALTLYHWDLPLALHEQGGWLSSRTVDAFVAYTQTVVDRVGDRVPLWMTINEPWAAGMLSYGTTAIAPGRGDGAAALKATHNLLLAHGAATAVARSPSRAVGIVVNLSPMVPASASTADQAAARRLDGHLNRWFLDPLLCGRYPDDMVEWYAPAFTGIVRDADMRTIAAPVDFLGVNYYCRMHVAAGDDPSDPLAARPPLSARTVVPPGIPTTAMGWPVEPAGLPEMLHRLRRDYPDLPPIYITENGAAYDDRLEPGGVVQDDERIGFLHGHLSALHQAIAAGVDVRGYFCWSLLDNFEWHNGYAKRFGLIHVDYPTQRRTAKASAHWYARVISRNGLADDPRD